MTSMIMNTTMIIITGMPTRIECRGMHGGHVVPTLRRNTGVRVQPATPDSDPCDYLTLTSSTSKIRSAFGGIMPPGAPREP